ncbi:LysR substrate-binding domain-containing protein [Paenibacillus gyeongsangnamensis]|uniref:LysR substrate-binding domain-containing protein n=1 Tax=Paenibacillus gyeongsangnamensis TaxID=3388067 RepID=UPI002FD74BE0
MYRHIRQAFEELDSGERSMRDLKQFKEGRLRIGANGAIIKDCLLSLLDQFHAQYPGIRIQLS